MLIDRLAGYVEYVGVEPGDSESDYQAGLGTGVTYALSENVRLDAGTNIGMNKAADDLNIFGGITIRE